MKKTTLTLLLTIVCCWLAAQCPTDDIGFFTQAQIDGFPLNYPGCKDLPGHVFIDGEDIGSLEPLIGIASIGGDLQIGYLGITVSSVGSNLLLQNLSGLDSLHTIGGSLGIFYNEALVSLTGLNGLKYIGNSLEIARNHALTSLSALTQLDTIPGSVSIGKHAQGLGGGYPIGNASLSTLKGLHNIRHIGGNLNVLSGTLPNMNGLENLRSIGGSLIVRDQYTLQSFAGLDSLQFIGEAFRFLENFSNTSFVGLGVQTVSEIEVTFNYSLFAISGLDRLKSVYGEVFIAGNDSLLSINGFNQLQRIDSFLSISYNNSLSVLDGFQNLRNIQGISLDECQSLATLNAFNNLDSISDFFGIYNTGLNDLNGLKNLSYCKGLSIVHNKILTNINLPSLKSLGDSYLTIEDNDALSTLQGLDSLDYTTINGLYILGNSTLTFCHIEPICKYLESGGNAFIGNAPGCFSVGQVKSKCQSLPTEKLFSENLPLQISPNPATDFLQIQISNPETWDISLFDLRGRQMFSQKVSGSQTIYLKDWPSGIYTLRAVSGGRVFAGKIVKSFG